MFSRLAFRPAASAVLALFVTGSVSAGIVASDYSNYVPGNVTGTALGSYTTASSPLAALGLPNGDTGFFALTPFNPPFDPGQLTGLAPTGQITLQLSRPLTISANAAIGIFTNTGFVDAGGDNTSKTGDPVALLSPDPRNSAIVSVSNDGTDWTLLNNGDPINFDIPTNYYTDTTITTSETGGYNSAPLGTQSADFYKPFWGDLNDFDDLNYNQIKTLLNGSAGGKWIDLSSLNLSQIQFINFMVPDNASYHLLLDAVTAVPEPTTGLVWLGASLLLIRRRRTV